MNIPRPISGWVPPADSVSALQAFKERMRRLHMDTLFDLPEEQEITLYPSPRYEMRNMLGDEIHERIYGE
jgi:hypothetical protein